MCMGHQFILVYPTHYCYCSHQWRRGSWFLLVYENGQTISFLYTLLNSFFVNIITSIVHTQFTPMVATKLVFDCVRKLANRIILVYPTQLAKNSFSVIIITSIVHTNGGDGVGFCLCTEPVRDYWLINSIKGRSTKF